MSEWEGITLSAKDVELLRGIVAAYEEAMAREGMNPQARERVHNTAMLGHPDGARGIRWTNPSEKVDWTPGTSEEEAHLAEEERRFRLCRDQEERGTLARHARGDEG